MNEIRTIALNGINDFGTTTQQQESIDRSWQTLLDHLPNNRMLNGLVVPNVPLSTTINNQPYVTHLSAENDPQPVKIKFIKPSR